MNDPAPASASAPVAEPEKTNVVRIVLFAVLVVMIVALIYEYGFVRKSYKAAEIAVDDFVDRRGDEELLATPEVVQARIGKKPVGGLQDKGDYLLEHYQWTRWLPWKTYDIYVVYEPGDPPVLFNTTRPDPPGPGETPFPRTEDSALAGAVDPPAPPAPGMPGAGPFGPSDPARRRPEADEEAPNQHGENVSTQTGAGDLPPDTAADAEKSAGEPNDSGAQTGDSSEPSETPEPNDSEATAPESESAREPGENE